MWRVGSAERYPHHGPPSNAVVVNGASGELVSWDRAEETLRSLRCSKRVLDMCGRCVHGVAPAVGGGRREAPAARAHRPEKRRLPTSPTQAKQLVWEGGQRTSELYGAAARTSERADPPRPSRAPPPPPPPPKRSGQGICTAIRYSADAAGRPPKPPAPDFHARKRIAPSSPPRASSRGGGLGASKTCQRVSFGSARVKGALSGTQTVSDVRAESQRELFPKSHRREAPPKIDASKISLRGGLVTCDQARETNTRAGRRAKPTDGPPQKAPVRKKMGDWNPSFHSTIVLA